MRHMMGLFLVGCGTVPPGVEDSVLQPDFLAAVGQGWVCRGWGQVGPPPNSEGQFPPVSYAGLDAGELLRVQVHSLQAEVTYTDALDFSGDHLVVYTGASLIVDESDDKCDDVIVNPSQRLDYGYRAIAGTTVVVEDGDRIAIEVQGLVLRPDNVALLSEEGLPDWEALPDVEVEDGTLPLLPVTES